MRRLLLFIVIFFLLVFCVPWFFISGTAEQLHGFPVWAFYVVVMTVFCSLGLMVLFEFGWSVFDDEDEDD